MRNFLLRLLENGRSGRKEHMAEVAVLAVVVPREGGSCSISDLTQDIRNANRCEAICEAVRKTGKILVAHFPAQKNDKNELNDIIIR